MAKNTRHRIETQVHSDIPDPDYSDRDAELSAKADLVKNRLRFRLGFLAVIAALFALAAIISNFS